MAVPARELYDQHAEEFDADTNLEALPDEFHTLLSSFVDSLAGPAILDAGCGPGRDIEYFYERDLDPVGVDIARGMVERARAHRPGKYLQMDVRDLAFRDGRFDGIWCPATIFFVPTAEMATVVSGFSRVLAPDGIARVGFKLGEGPLEVEKWGATTMEYHVPEEQARTLLEGAGFRVDSVSVNPVSPQRTFANFLCRQANRE